MTKSVGFIANVEDIADFYAIKRYIQSLEYARLIYCTINDDQKLYITTQRELENGRCDNEQS